MAGPVPTWQGDRVVGVKMEIGGDSVPRSTDASPHRGRASLPATGTSWRPMSSKTRGTGSAHCHKEVIEANLVGPGHLSYPEMVGLSLERENR